MKIRSVKEPEHSSRELLDFEKKYGFSSEYFYDHYRQGESLIDDDYIASKWAFEYEINRRAKEKRVENKDDFLLEGGRSYGSSLFLNIYFIEMCDLAWT